jgi:D-glycero-D-manno-heptose 1,7-bisphosphate phosphatase
LPAVFSSDRNKIAEVVRYCFAVSALFTDVQLVFLDRDGVINRKPPEGDYVAAREQFEFLPEAPQAIAKLNRAGVKVAVVTNQRGVALGKMSEADLIFIHDHMEHELRAYQAHVDAIFYCPHDGNSCQCRKPSPGLLVQAFGYFRQVQPANAILIGDSLPDIEAGRGAGVRTIVVQGPTTTQKSGFAEAKVRANATARSLSDAVSRLMGFR